MMGEFSSCVLIVKAPPVPPIAVRSWLSVALARWREIKEWQNASLQNDDHLWLTSVKTLNVGSVFV